MSLLTVIQAVAVQVALPEPLTVINATKDSDEFKLVEFSVEAGKELERRVFWPDLVLSDTLVGSGNNVAIKIGEPGQFSRMIRANAVTNSAGIPVRAISLALTIRFDQLEGIPRYYVLLANDQLGFSPFAPLGDISTVFFQDKNWALKNGQPATDWNLDSDTAKVPENLIIQGTIWRWKRHKSQPFENFQAEYEATLTELAMDETGLKK